MYVPLQLVVEGCVRPGYVRADVEAGLLDVLSARTLPGGARGFFHPDGFTFGQPLYVSDLVAAAMSVARTGMGGGHPVRAGGCQPAGQRCGPGGTARDGQPRGAAV